MFVFLHSQLLMPSWAHLIHIISKAQAGSQSGGVGEEREGAEAGSTLSFIRVQACSESANVGNVWLNYVMILQQLLSVSLFPSPLPSLSVLHFQLFVVISVYWFYEPKHFVNVFIMHRMWQRGRGNFDYALPQLNKLLSHLLFKCFYVCVLVCVCVVERGIQNWDKFLERGDITSKVN